MTARECRQTALEEAAVRVSLPSRESASLRLLRSSNIYIPCVHETKADAFAQFQVLEKGIGRVPLVLICNLGG